jgi:pyruvate,water dikinase
LAGGKGANLGELLGAGFDVPDGFVVTTRAYLAVAALLGFAGASIFATQGEPDRGSVRASFEQAEVPQPLAARIAAAYAELGGGPVAVRSSATAEDLPGAAFAGQQDTYLDVDGEAAVFDAVRRCWGSLWSERALAYRRRLGIRPARWRSPSSCNAWSGPSSPASCSRPTPSAAAGTRSSSTLPPVSVRPSSPVWWSRTITW